MKERKSGAKCRGVRVEELLTSELEAGLGHRRLRRRELEVGIAGLRRDLVIHLRK